MSLEIVHQPCATLTGRRLQRKKESNAMSWSLELDRILLTFNAIIDVFPLKLNSVSVFITLIVLTVLTRYFRIKNY